MLQDEQKNINSTDKVWEGLLGAENASKVLSFGWWLKKYGGAPGKWLSKKLDKFDEDYFHLLGMGETYIKAVKKLGISDKEMDLLALRDRKAFSTRLTIEQERFQQDMFDNPESRAYKRVNK